MIDDHLDREVSIGVELTESGVKAKAKSRFVSAVDRLFGNFSELANVPMERRISRERSLIEGEKKVIGALVEYGVNRIKTDPEFAQRVAEKHFQSTFNRQMNKDDVVKCAIEDLRNEPISHSDAEKGPDTLDAQFLNRLERYAEDASTDELRQRWGRVLSAEIRKPGTFSAKVLRVIDELDSDTALLFEKLCGSLFATSCLPRSLVGDLSLDQQIKLTSAGLLAEPGLGQIRSFMRTTSNKGDEIWLLNLGRFGLAFPVDAKLSIDVFNMPDASTPLMLDDEKSPSIPIYILTAEGSAIATILPDMQHEAFSKLAGIIEQTISDAKLLRLERDQSGGYRPLGA
jgi:hypothetical protein